MSDHQAEQFDPAELLRVLERATAPLGQSDAGLDQPTGPLGRQTAGLREAWRVWGQWLESTSSEPPVLVMPEPEHRPTPVSPGKPKFVWTLRRTARVMAAAAIAVVVLVAVTITWSLRRSGGIDAPRVVEQSQAAGTAHTVANVASRKTAAAGTATSRGAAAGLLWDDALDAELADVQQRVIVAQSGRWTSGAELSVVQFSVQQIQQEIDENRF